MDNERSSVISIGGTDYELVLTTRATKEIAGRYGGLENLGDKLMKNENFEMALEEIVWLGSATVRAEPCRGLTSSTPPTVRSVTSLPSAWTARSSCPRASSFSK